MAATDPASAPEKPSDEATRGYAKGRAKRQQIIEAATDVFGEVGYQAASLREIAARCGLSHPGVLHHFPTKESLLLSVLEHRDRVDVDQMQADDSGGVETLWRIVDLVARNASRRGMVELFTRLSAEATSPDHPAHEFFAHRYIDAVELVRCAYQRAAEEGDLRPAIDPDTAARQLVALMDGLQVQWLLDEAGTDMPAIVAAHVRAQLARPPLDSS